MKKTMTRNLIHAVYVIIGNSRLNDLKKTDDKVAVLKILRELRYVAKKYEEDADDAGKRLKPDDFDELRSLATVYEAERNDGKQPTAMTQAEYHKFVATLMSYNQAVEKAMSDIDKSTVELEFEPLAGDVLLQLMDANRWTVDQYLKTEEALTEE